MNKVSRSKDQQRKCFDINIMFWKFLGIWPNSDSSSIYKIYTTIIITVFVFLFNLLATINFYFLPNDLNLFVEEMIFYFNDVTAMIKILTFLFMRGKIGQLLDELDTDALQATSEKAVKIINSAINYNKQYWKIVMSVSLTAHLTQAYTPVVKNLLHGIPLKMPICSYSFLSEDFKEKFMYPLYFYQVFGIEIHMFGNLNIDTFILGMMTLVNAQLDILDDKLRSLMEVVVEKDDITQNEKYYNSKLIQCVDHFDKVSKFCEAVEEVFGLVLFVQFSAASCIICACLFQLLLPAPWQYYIFLITYMIVIVGIQIFMPCWIGTQVMEKSFALSQSAYSCDWTARQPGFKTNLRLFVERSSRPISIVGGKMFPLSLTTFSSIMNSAYSFFTLLRHMQSRQDEPQ